MFPKSNAFEASERSIAVSIPCSTEVCRKFCRESDSRQQFELELGLGDLKNPTNLNISRRVVRLTRGVKLIGRLLGQHRFQ